MAWCGLSHLGLTGLGGWVTAGHAAGGTERPGFHKGDRETQSLYLHFETRLTLTGCNQGGKSPPAKRRLILAALALFIQSAAPATLAGNQPL